MKTCTTCSKQLDLQFFYKDNKAPDGLRSQCKYCVKLVKQQYFKKNRKRELDKLKKWKEQNPDKVKAGNLRNLYGISPEQYFMMLKSQGNCCAICNSHQSLNVVDKRNNKPRDLSVDHNHSTSEIRGLLCYSCNLAIGMLKDNIERAKKLVEYLKLYEEKT